MTKEKFGITLLFTKAQSYQLTYLQLSGISFTEKVPYDRILIFKNDNIKSDIQISIIENLKTQMLLFPDTSIILYEGDKIGIKLV